MNTEDVLGTVTSNEDPAQAGRVKATVAALDGQEYPEWIEPVHPPCCFFPPEPEDTIAIEVPNGDDIIEFSGEVAYKGILSDEEHPFPAEFKTNYPKRRGIKTKYGHLLIFDDKDKLIMLQTATGHKITLDDVLNVIHIKNSNAVGTVKLDTEHSELSGTATDYVIKGTSFNTAIATLYGKWSACLGALSAIQSEWAGAGGMPWTPVPATQAAFATALSELSSAITAYGAAVAGFTSVRAKVG